MTTYPQGLTAGALPAPTAAAYPPGLVHTIIFAVDPTNTTTVVAIQQGGITLKAFNKGAASGSNDSNFVLQSPCEANAYDPTKYSTTSTGCYVTYVIA